MPKASQPTPTPTPTVTCDWSRPVQPGQAEGLRRALFGTHQRGHQAAQVPAGAPR